MTTLVAWVGIDQRGPASIYLGSDSRISWPGVGMWDHGRKLFAVKDQPHLLGYCGEVFLPTQVLSQIVEMIDGGLLLERSGTPDASVGRIMNVVTDCLISYPAKIGPEFSILYATRTAEGTGCSFHLY